MTVIPLRKEDVFEYAPLLLPAVLSLFLCFAPFRIAVGAAAVILPILFFFLFSRPVTGVYALVITSASLDAIPDKFNLQLFVFLLVCAVVLIRFALDISIPEAKRLSAHLEARILFCFALLIALNFFVAQANGVSASLWFRGSAPFLFLLLAFACMHYFRLEEHVHFTLLSVVIYGAILMVQQLNVAVSERVWIPDRYIYESGAWVKALGDYGEPFWKRITLLFPQSTDPAFLVGFFVLTIWIIYSPRTRLLALGPVLGFLFCMVLTYSRSFMIALSAGFLFIIGCLFSRRQTILAGKFAAGLLAALLCILVMVELFDLAPFKNRYVTLYNTLHQIVAIVSTPGEEKDFSSSFSRFEMQAADPNIIGRGEEIRIAWAMFQDNPLLGKGFGIQHDLPSHLDFGVKKKGYIHNWFFYFLMTTGLIGTILYSSLYAVPLFRLFRNAGAQASAVELIVGTSILLLCLYSMLFASFRLIPYNIILACLISMPLALSAEGRR